MNNEVLNSNIETEESKKIGMRWYKFITYFWFPFEAVMDVVVAALFIRGFMEKIINSISVENIEIEIIDDKLYDVSEVYLKQGRFLRSIATR